MPRRIEMTPITDRTIADPSGSSSPAKGGTSSGPGHARSSESRERSAAAFVRDGFAIAPGVLDADEVARLRADVTASLEERRIPFALGHVLPNASVEAPRTQWILHHPNVVEAVKRCLGTNLLQYTMEA